MADVDIYGLGPSLSTVTGQTKEVTWVAVNTKEVFI